MKDNVIVPRQAAVLARFRCRARGSRATTPRVFLGMAVRTSNIARRSTGDGAHEVSTLHNPGIGLGPVKPLPAGRTWGDPKQHQNEINPARGRRTRMGESGIAGAKLRSHNISSRGGGVGMSGTARTDPAWTWHQHQSRTPNDSATEASL